MNNLRYVGRLPVTLLTDVEAQVDMARLRLYRLGRVREQLKQRDLPACVLFDPVNIRYATGRRDWVPFAMHVWSGYVFVPAEGPVVLFGGRADTSIGLETIDDVRPAVDLSYLLAGHRIEANIAQWAEEIADLMQRQCGKDHRIAMDRCELRAAAALTDRGFTLHDAQEPLEHARAIKSTEEIACMTFAIAVAEAGMARMREALRPGMTENELWSILYQTNIAMGGEWIEARLLTSGDRINPWFHECSDRLIRGGELVAFDTDMVGPFGYCADISRTFHCGPGKPTKKQRDMYKLACEEVYHNIELIKPSVSFREFSERAWKQPADCVANRYVVAAHGIGMCDEYPAIYYQQDWKDKGLDGMIEENMTLCVESFIGPDGSDEGVRFEEQVLVTATGTKLLSKFPLEDDLLV